MSSSSVVFVLLCQCYPWRNIPSTEGLAQGHAAWQLRCFQWSAELGVTPGSNTTPCQLPQFCAGAAEYLLGVWNIFMPEKALIVNLLALKTFTSVFMSWGDAWPFQKWK